MTNFTIENAAPEQDKQGSGTITTAQDFDAVDQSSADTNDTVYYNEIPLEIKDIAKEYIEWGLCAIPPRQGEKRPIGTWREYQERLPTDDEWEQWSNADAIGIVCGKISGNLLVIDFDQQGKVFEDYKSKISDALWQRLVIEQSPSGGYHIFVRSEEPVGGNEALAWEWDAGTDKWEKLIETRAEGGFIVCSPSPGYTMIQGDFGNIPVLQADEIELLLNTARTFDTKPKSETKTISPSPTTSHQKGDSFDWFVKSGEWRNHLVDLTAKGWVFLEEKDRQLFFQTPEGDRGYGKHDGNIKDGSVYIFSRAPAPFEENKGYSICQLFAGALFGSIDKAGLKKFAKKYLADAPKQSKAETNYTPEFCDKLLQDLDVRVFGQDEERRIHGYSFHMRRWFVIKDRNRYTYLDLIGDCGSVVDEYVVKKTEEQSDTKYSFEQVYALLHSQQQFAEEYGCYRRSR